MIRTSAPGSVMLFGEHAVLHGYPAVVMAVARRVHVSVTPRADRRVRIVSALATRERSLDEIEPSAPLAFVERAILACRPELPTGMEMVIESDFPPTVGLGSSAAVTVAALAALRRLAGRGGTPAELAREAVAVIRAVQGAGSGADAWASALGGLRVFARDGETDRPLRGAPPLLLVYSGRKTPTPVVIERVEALRRRLPAVVGGIFSAIGALSLEGAAAIEAGDWRRLGAAMNIGHDLMAALGVDTPELRAIANVLRSDPGVYGAKISGSGLGDCVVAVGRRERTVSDERDIEVAVSADGVRFEEEGG
ncbi:MAG: mevalonate kinase [Kiritimatiellae bacterium]|nr:mevalonate kinase [Kiritimatiellia bacterium]